MPKLIYHDSDGVDRTLNLGAEPVLIGRATECEVQTQDAMVSRRHARIFWDGNYWIEDLGSSNGVYVGQERVERAPFRPGDTVTCGSLVLRMVPDATPRPRVAPSEVRAMAPTASAPPAGDDSWAQADRERAGLSLALSQLQAELAVEVQRREQAEAAALVSADRLREANRRAADLEVAASEAEKLKRKVEQLTVDLKRARGSSPTIQGVDEITRDEKERMLRIAAEEERNRLRLKVAALELQLADSERAADQIDPEEIARLRADLKRAEQERDVARTQAAEVRAFVSAKSANSQATTEAATALNQALTELRRSLRAVSDEAALVSAPVDSARRIADALSSGVAQLETALANVQALNKSLGLQG